MNLTGLIDIKENAPMKLLPDQAEREVIIGTMRRWLEGEPVWSHDEIIQHWGREFQMYRTAWASGVDVRPSIGRTIALTQLRDEAIAEFGFVIPCRELLDVLARHQPIIEIGAGSGYLTALMRNRGIDVIGSDIGDCGYTFKVSHYDSMQQRLEGKTAVRRYRDRTVFCSWPTLNHTWFRQTLRAMCIGQRAIIVEEDACSEETTWTYRDASFAKLADIPLPAWNFMNDRASVWIKKRHHAMRVPMEGFGTEGGDEP